MMEPKGGPEAPDSPPPQTERVGRRQSGGAAQGQAVSPGQWQAWARGSRPRKRKPDLKGKGQRRTKASGEIPEQGRFQQRSLGQITTPSTAPTHPAPVLPSAKCKGSQSS